MEKQIGPYDIVRLLGTGGMGSVYEAVHSQIQRRVAIKVLHKDFQKDPEFVQRFFNEARAVNIIDHPNIVAISDFGTSAQGSPYIVMEYLEGDSLRQRLARTGKLAPEAAMRIAKQVALGLVAAHSKKVVHRDLKPVNILLIMEQEGSERAKILDFGIAKLAADPGSTALTRVGVSLGTPAYMSPEQCKSARDVSDRSDIYSLGLILFEVLSGEHPFSGSDGDTEMMASHIGKEPPNLDGKAPGCPPDLASLVRRMLAKQPEARPSAGEVAAILGRLSGSTTGLLSAVVLPEHPTLQGQSIEETDQKKTSVKSSTGLAQLLEGRGLYIAAGLTLLFALLGIGIVVRLLLEGSAAPPQLVRWQIRSEPSDSEVVDATGQVLGKTPLQYTHARGSQIEVLSIRKEGFSEQRTPVDCSRDGEASITLGVVGGSKSADALGEKKPQEKAAPVDGDSAPKKDPKKDRKKDRKRDKKKLPKK